jgi:hypothetical protein
MPDWFMKQFEELAASQPFGDGRVNLGLAFDGLWLAKEVVQGVYKKARKLGIKLITTHYVKNAVLGEKRLADRGMTVWLTHAGMRSIPDVLAGYDLLRPDILLSHANGAPEKDAELLSSAGAYISCTPDTELQMGLGMSMAFQSNFKRIASFGVDCHSNNRSDMLTQMHLGLQTARAMYNQTFVAEERQPLKLNATVEDAFKIGTIQGARAINMEDQIGSLAEGKLADIVIFNGTSPGMICASEHDPIAAIVSHASIRDIETVIVNGIIRKEKGHLNPTPVDTKISANGQSDLDWDDVAAELVRSRREIQARIEKLGIEVGRKTLMQAFQIDGSKFVSEV